MSDHQNVHGKKVFPGIGPLLLVLAVLLGTTLNLNAQIATGGITGTVTDSSGAKVVAATITLTNTSSGVATRAITTSTGTYVFNAVLAGTYSLQATQKGFKTFTATGIEIHVQQTDTLDIQLEVGSISENVTVSTDPAVIQTEDATLGQTISETSMDDMPLNGRNWASLGMLAAGTTTATTAAASGTNPTGSASSTMFAVNGTSYWQNDFRLNGIDNNVEFYGGSEAGSNASITPPPDAIQEFKLQSGDYSAEFGHSTGAVINAVVKSGGNRISGDLWEYVRNTDFDANDYFSKQAGIPRAPYHQNQYGGTVGGPVLIPKIYNGRNKTFFFVDMQATRIIVPIASTNTVPTSLQRTSGFSNLSDLITYSNNAGTAPQQDGLGRKFPLGAVFDPSTTRQVAAGAIDPVSGLHNTSDASIWVRDPFFGGQSIAGITDFTSPSAESQMNQLPGSLIDPNMVTLLNLFPEPTSSGISNNYYQSASGTRNINQYDVRIDQNFGTKDTLFGVYSLWHLHMHTPTPLPGIADGGYYGLGTEDHPHWAVATGYSHTFTPTLVNEFHFGINHSQDNIVADEAYTYGLPAKYGIPGVAQNPGNGGLPIISIGSLTELGVGGWTPTLATIRSEELADNVTKVYGSHTFKTGYQWDRLEGDLVQPGWGRGGFYYNGQFSTIPAIGSNITAIADALLIPQPSSVGGPDYEGGLNQVNASNYAPANEHRYYMGAYFQDDWKVTPKLTLNLGLRWDLTTPYAENNGRQSNFIGGGNGNGPGGTLYVPTETCGKGVSAAFNAQLAADGITTKCVSGLNTGEYQTKNFAPRVGFAYRLMPRAVIRGGYGIAYGALGNIGFGGTLATNYPYSFNIFLSAASSVSPMVATGTGGATATIENSLANLNVQDPANVSTAGIGLYGRQYDFQTPYTQTMNLSVQYQLSHADAIQAAYVGALGRHLDVLGSHNSPSVLLPPGADLYANIPNPDFQPNSNYETTNGASSYNSLQIVYSRQMSRGLMLLGNWTYSRCEQDQLGLGQGVSSYRAEWLPGFGPKGDFQRCDTDAKHVVHVSGSYDLPFGRGRQFMANAGRAADLALGGWDINFIYTDQGGQPFTIPCAVSTVSFFGCNANVVSGQDLYKGGHTQKQWLNPNAFATPPIATADSATIASLGGEGAQARGPRYTNVDASLFKNFRITEQTKLQFRAEAFNLANHPQFDNPPSSNLNYTSASNFSQITSERGLYRVLQLALKLYY
jgi:hypothetical protein